MKMKTAQLKKNKKRKKDVFATDFVPLRLCGVPEDSGLGLADKVSKWVYFESAV